MEKDLSRSYKEINIILDILGDEYKNKVPKKMKELFKVGQDKEYSPNLTLNEFLEGNYLEDTKIILSALNINYWCTSEQKNEYMETLRKIDEQYKEEHKIVLNEIFPNKDRFENIETNDTETQIVEAKKGGIAQIISNLLDKIKNLFRK